MKKKLKFILLISFTFILSCNKKNKTAIIKNREATNTSVATLNDSIIKLANKAIVKGDTLAYNSACKFFSINFYEKEFLYYSITMADKYEYSQAYFDTYMILLNVNAENNITGCKLCNYYLLKSYEKNNHYAKDEVKELFTNKGLKIPTSTAVLQGK